MKVALKAIKMVPITYLNILLYIKKNIYFIFLLRSGVPWPCSSVQRSALWAWYVDSYGKK